MSLSAREQRLLAEIEFCLADDEPRLARALSTLTPVPCRWLAPARRVCLLIVAVLIGAAAEVHSTVLLCTALVMLAVLPWGLLPAVARRRWR